MSVVVKRIMEEASVVTNGNAVMEVTEGYYVSGLDITKGPAYALFSAINATGLPTPWTAHPYIPNVNLVSYSPRFVKQDTAKVTLTYVNVQPQLIVSGGCGLITVQTDEDRNGAPILVSNQNTGATPPVAAAIAKVQAGLHTVFKPQATIVIQRIRADSFYGGIDPKAQIAFVGKTNSNTTFGYSPGTLLVENIGFNNDGFAGVAWRMQYEFRHNPKGWNNRIAWTDRETGHPGTQLVKAPGYDAGTVSSASDPQYGRKICDDYEQVDFAPLLA